MWRITTGIPAPEDIRAVRGAGAGIDFGERIRIHVESRAVLDAISDALDVLYVQFAASEPLPIADELPA
ncbi:MAG: hypothetical protein NTV85_28590 [Hyphomicrobiales bacterium]|nr:hypothetical protein [Hyphomicrobiales bacterium]